MNQSRTRTHDIHLRLNTKEYHSLEENRLRCGLSQQNYLRRLILGISPKEIPPPDFFEILKDLRQINNNLNQIAAKANSMNFIDTAAYWENVNWLQKMVGKMIEVMYG